MSVEMIRKALDRAGYVCEPTEANLRECFLDYVAEGYFADLTMEAAKKIDIERVARRMARI
jgi:hypothetical protein